MRNGVTPLGPAGSGISSHESAMATSVVNGRPRSCFTICLLTASFVHEFGERRRDLLSG